MESTIFDFDVTSQELKLLYIESRNKEEYIQRTSSRKILQDLYVLFRMREDIVRAGTVKEKLFGRVA